jgi:hypothetical protein
MNVEDNNDLKNVNITNYESLDNPPKKVSIQIQVDLFPKIIQKTLGKDIEENNIKLPTIIPKQVHKTIQTRTELKRKLTNLENFCQSIYTSSNTTMNNTKTIEEILNDSKMKAINEIKKDFFLNQIQPKKEDNNDIYKKIKIKIKPKSLRKVNLKRDQINPEKQKYIYVTTSNERNRRENRNIFNNINHYSIDRINSIRNKINFNDYASNRIMVNHPQLYVLSNARENRIKKLPQINRNKIHIISGMSKIIPDQMELSLEEKKNRYDEFMMAKELKSDYK